MSTSLLPLTYWPGPGTTGIPDGAALSPAGSLELRTDGQVVADLHVTGRIDVYAKDVVIRRSRITCEDATSAIRTFASTVNLLVEDVEIDGRGQGGVAVQASNYTLRRLDIHDVVDGIGLGSRTTVADSWIHDLTRTGTSHNDCLWVFGGRGIVVRHNRLDAYRSSTSDPMNSCLTVGSAADSSVDGLLFEDNYCNGGNYAIDVHPDVVASNVVFRANRFGRNCRYGIVTRPHSPGLTWENTNVWLHNALPVIPRPAAG